MTYCGRQLDRHTIFLSLVNENNVYFAHQWMVVDLFTKVGGIIRHRKRAESYIFSLRLGQHGKEHSGYTRIRDLFHGNDNLVSCCVYLVLL